VAVTPGELFAAAGFAQFAAVPWGKQVPSSGPGVYVVGVRADAGDPGGAGAVRIDLDALRAWLEPPGDVMLHGRPATVPVLAAHVARWWLPDEPVLYVGKATSLLERVSQYYGTPLGARSPHRGGYWLKMLDEPRPHTVFYAATPTVEGAKRAEACMLRHFLDHARAPVGHADAELPLPWANLEIVQEKRLRRAHGITF